jgi:hypothetical protein
VLRIVERFDAEGIAGEEKRLIAAIPDSEGEHAAQAGEAFFAPVCEGREEDFGVALGAEDAAGGSEFGAEFAEVVEGAIEDDVVAAVGRSHRLVTVRGIKDRKASHAEAGRAVGDETVVVGAAVEHGGVHALDGGAACVGGNAGADEAGYAAHGEMRPIAERSGLAKGRRLRRDALSDVAKSDEGLQTGFVCNVTTQRGLWQMRSGDRRVKFR